MCDIVDPTPDRQRCSRRSGRWGGKGKKKKKKYREGSISITLQSAHTTRKMCTADEGTFIELLVANERVLGWLESLERLGADNKR